MLCTFYGLYCYLIYYTTHKILYYFDLESKLIKV